MTDFTYQALGAPRNDRSIPNNPDPIPANDDPGYFDMGLCGPYRTDHAPATPDTADPYCGMFKVPVLRNVATRGSFFHNGVFHSLEQVLDFYNTRDTNPEYWYPSRNDGTGAPKAEPVVGLQPTSVPGATVDEIQRPAGRAARQPRRGDAARHRRQAATRRWPAAPGRAQPGSAPAMTPQQIADLVCFLGTLSDGYQPPAKPPTGGTVRQMTSASLPCLTALLMASALLAGCDNEAARLPNRDNFTADGRTTTSPSAATCAWPSTTGRSRCPAGSREPRRTADAGAREAADW